ncbi:MAG TPA: ABC transporter permease [Candidatus Acidoferrum sp.]|jgi:predicted permease
MNWLRQLFSRRGIYNDLSAEMHQHLEEKIEELVATGMPRNEATAAARRAFGNLTLIENDSRAVWRWRTVEHLLNDIRFGVRILRKNPGFAAVAILTLALGIGANTAIFSLVYGALLAPLPMPHPEQLVMVWLKVDGDRNVVSPGDFFDWKRQNAVFQNLVAWDEATFSLSVGDHPEALQVRIMTPGFFDMQGIPMQIGRDFAPEEAELGKNHVLIMTHRLWQERFGGDKNILGRQVRLNSELYTVVGVLAAGMPDRYESHLFLPMALRPDQITHERHWMTVMGRLRPGVTLRQANADMDWIAQHIAQTYPSSNKGFGVLVEPLKNDFTSRDTIRALWLLMGAVGCVLLIACVNVANLLLSRGTVRMKEAALRASLGATRSQLFSQFLTESLVLALIGGTLGVALAGFLLKVIVTLLPQFSVPTESDIRLNVPVLLFSLAAAIFAGVLCGSAPAWQISHRDLSGALKEGGRSASNAGRHGLRRALVVIEFALALTLLAGAGLAIHSFWNLTRVDLGFREDHILTFTLPTEFDRFPNAERMVAFYHQMLEKVSNVPGVTSASLSTTAPVVGGSWWGMEFRIAGQPSDASAPKQGSRFVMISPGYFQTFGIRILKGRDFTDRDNAASTRVAMVNETFVKQYLANLDPLAQRVVVRQLGMSTMGPPVEWQIVGVFHDVRNRNARREDAPEIDVPFWQSPLPFVRISARTAADPANLSNSLAAAVHSVDPDLALDHVITMDQAVDEWLADDRFAMLLFAGFAGVALLLAAIGIYGVMSFVVAQRTHEIGLRMALGANSREVLFMVLNEGMLLALAGLFLGLGGTYFVGRTMKSILYGVTAIDPAAFSLVAAVLLSAAMLACYLPARRATQVDPMVALRYE